ncbi:MAG: SusD/RagB family nutrient-binding outer membrane lipoprotein [Chitinophagaceae bacterium]|nr:SusD/RagB family nutrient-binding outer membrane lipoprotein [Chitinophagaceae bacterium]
MKNNITGFNLLAVMCLVVTFSSCTKNFEELNTDKTRIVTLKGKQLDKLFTTAEYAGITNTDQWAGGYQLLQSLYTDEQAQFFACTQPRFPSDRNTMVGNWINGGWGAFLQGANTLASIIKNTGPESEVPDPVRHAVAQIWKVYIYMPMTDMFGPIPYSQVGNGEDQVLYDSQESIYQDFMVSLADATAVLNQNISQGTTFADGDVIFDGNLNKWLKFGNSLRLRVAMRVSRVDAGKAQSEAEAAANDQGGLITENADNAFMRPSPPNYLNPLGVISEWGEFRMSASMESIMKGYSDPRIPKYWEPTKNNGGYKGIRNGLTIEQMSEVPNSNENNSNVPSRFQNAANTTEPHGLMVAAETWFNLAEAKLNGWNVSSLSPKELYEGGIAASMAQWGVSGGDVTTYIASNALPIALSDIYNTPAASNIPVAWGATEAVQREQIGTQKWLALYPSMSPEAWSEFRRTGYPKLLPRLNNDNPELSTSADAMKRLIFPPDESIINPAGYQSGVGFLGGDRNNIPMWWDVD